MSKGCHEPLVKWITKTVDEFITAFSKVLTDLFPALGDFIPNYAFHFFIILINIFLSTPNLILYFVGGSNAHISFWLGEAPRYVNLMVPLTLLALNLSIPLVTAMAMRKSGVSWYLFVMFLIVGLAIFAGGLVVIVQTASVVDSLWYSCGTDAMTRKIQSEWQRLADFQSRCLQAEGDRGRYIQQCPGFGAVRNGHEAYVDYIEDMELDYSCQGFCGDWPRPLFDPDIAGDPCAWAVGSELSNFGYWVGLPTMVTGQLTIWIGQCLSRYSHI